MKGKEKSGPSEMLHRPSPDRKEVGGTKPKISTAQRGNPPTTLTERGKKKKSNDGKRRKVAGPLKSTR